MNVSFESFDWVAATETYLKQTKVYGLVVTKPLGRRLLKRLEAYLQYLEVRLSMELAVHQVEIPPYFCPYSEWVKLLPPWELTRREINELRDSLATICYTLSK